MKLQAYCYRIVFIFICLFTEKAHSQDLSKGLEGYWNFCDCTAKDHSGNGRDGVFMGPPKPTCVKSIFDNGLHFAGAMSEYIIINNFPDLTKNLSISLWIKPEKFNFNPNPTITRGLTHDYYTLWFTPNDLYLLLNWNLPTQTWPFMPCTLKANQYYHLAAVYDYDNHEIRLYLDGVKLGSASYDQPIVSNNEALYFGSSFPGGQEYFQGILDEVRIYSRVLSDQEIALLANQTYNDPHFSLGNDTTICGNKEFKLAVKKHFKSYKWQDGSTDSVYTVTKTGTYSVTVNNGFCDNSDTILIKMSIPPTIKLPHDTTLCAGDTLLLDPKLKVNYMQWQNGSHNPTFTVKQAGTYTLAVSNDKYCFAYDTLYVNYLYPGGKLLPHDTTLCGDSFLLKPNIPGTKAIWQDSFSQPAYMVRHSGTYRLGVTIAKCKQKDSIKITLNHLPKVNLGPDLNLCEHESIKLNAFSGSENTYLWQNGNTDPVFKVDTGGLYWVKVTTPAGCSASDTLRVNSRAIPLPLLGNDTTICTGTRYVLNAWPFDTKGYSFLWNDGSTKNEYTISQPGTYSLKITSPYGCIGTDTLHVNMADALPVIIPNIFSPNGDNKNDSFYISGIQSGKDYSLQIFNYWGECIYQSNDPHRFWDGRYKGKLVQEGMYMYLLKHRNCQYQIHQYSGTVIVVR